MLQKKILLVEDEAAIAEPLSYVMQREGWQVSWHTTAHAALAELTQHSVDFIILDVGLPDIDGFELCRQIRQRWQTPLLFLTARNDEIERIIGIEIGADDYCAKPFSPKEIISRIKAIWRRMQLSAINSSSASNSAMSNIASQHQLLPQNTSQNNTTLLIGSEWQIDFEQYQVRFQQQLLNLTRYEFGLLTALLKQPERVFSRLQLMQQVWEHPDHSLERTVDSHIKTLRHKLKAICNEEYIVTHRGLGYSIKP